MAGAEERRTREPVHQELTESLQQVIETTGDPADVGYEAIDLLIRRLFTVGLDLHSALGHIQEHVAEHLAVGMIQRAIFALDQTIKDLRSVSFDLWSSQSVPCGVRRGLVCAVQQACGPGCDHPVITLSGGTDFPDEGLSGQVGAVLRQIFALIPADRLARAHVEMVPDPGPPRRLVVHIDVPGADLGDVAGRLGTPYERRVAVSSDAVGDPASRSYIRLEYPVPS